MVGEFKSRVKGWYGSIRNSLRMWKLKRNHKKIQEKQLRMETKSTWIKLEKLRQEYTRNKNKIQLHIRNQRKTEIHYLPRRKFHREGRRQLLVVSLFAIIFNYVSINHTINQMLTFLKKIERSERGKMCLKNERICMPSSSLLRT